jgi:hypothetical protein
MADKDNPAASAAKMGEAAAAQFANAAGLYGGAFAGSFKALQEYQAKLLHFVQENAAANIQLAQKMMQPRTPSDFVEFMGAQLRERATTIADQAKELADFAQTAAKKATESFTNTPKA